MNKVRTLLLTALTVIPLGAANAQVAGSINANIFEPAPGTNDNYIQVNSTSVLPSLQPAFGIVTQYANEPLVLEDPVTGRDAALIEHQLSSHLLAALGLGDIFQLGLDMPINWLLDEESSTTLPTRDLDNVAAGDLRIVPKLQLFGDAQRNNRGAGFAIIGNISVPTGARSNFQGWDGINWGVGGVGEWRFSEMFRIGATAGMNLRERQVIEALVVDNEFFYGGALAFTPVPNMVDIIAEITGRTAVDNDVVTSEATSPAEINAAARWIAMDRLAITVGGGAGVNEGYGSPNFRAFLGLNWAPPREVVERADIEVVDTDRDGIPDVADLCPTMPGSGPDGCPDFMGEDVTPVVMCPEDAEVIARLDELCERIYFDYNQDTIKPESQAVLDEIAELLQANPAVELLEIQGHADHTGPADYNLDLSMRRARAVEEALVQRGVDTARLTVRGFGENDPLVAGTGDVSRAYNRRVAFDVLRGPAPRCPAPPRIEDTAPRRRAPMPEKW